MAICIIPARGGSRRIPGKNIKLFHGKPIIAYSIDTAKESGLFDRIVVSTDDHDIAEVAMQYGAEVHWRSDYYSRDEIGTQVVAAHVLDWSGVQDGPCCVLYATAPMLKSQTLVMASLQLTPGTPYVVPVATWLRDPGQFYFGNINAFLFGASLHCSGTKLLWINPNTECDINTPEDWARAEQMYAALHNLEG